jgi:hypothetical protein
MSADASTEISEKTYETDTSTTRSGVCQSDLYRAYRIFQRGGVDDDTNDTRYGSESAVGESAALLASHYYPLSNLISRERTSHGEELSAD